MADLRVSKWKQGVKAHFSYLFQSIRWGLKLGEDPNIFETARLSRSELCRRIADAVFQKSRGKHVHRDTLRHQNLGVAPRQHVQSQLGDTIRRRHNVGLDAVAAGIPEIDNAAGRLGYLKQREG